MMEDILIDMIRDYQDLNPSFVEEFDGRVSPLVFSDYVKRNRPVVMRGLGHVLQIPALKKWSLDYLARTVGDRQIQIATTPEGNADSIINDIFVEPAYINMTMSTFLARLSKRKIAEEVLYLQSQNDNLHGELDCLLDDATEDIDFASQVFKCKPDATNVWIGDERSVTSLHKDPYENLYLVVHGTKTFDLLPPTEYFCLHERPYRTGRYVRNDKTGAWTVNQDSAAAERVPWIPVDPANPDLRRFPRFKHARPLQVTLKRGDMLYLPALWFHRVSQTCGSEEEAPLAVAVNWWYDLAYDSPVWMLSRLVRDMTLALGEGDDQTPLTR